MKAKKNRWTKLIKNDPVLFIFWPVVFVLLSSSQQLLDILGDLLGFADDVLCAGKRGIWLHLQIIQLRDRAALPQPATAPQPRSPAQTAEGNSEEIVSAAKIPAHVNCIQESENCLIVFPSSISTKHPSGWCSYPESSISESLNVLS